MCFYETESDYYQIEYTLSIFESIYNRIIFIQIVIGSSN